MTTVPTQVMREEVLDPLGMKNTGLDRVDLHETVPVSCRMGWDCGSTATDAAVVTGATRRDDRHDATVAHRLEDESSTNKRDLLNSQTESTLNETLDRLC